MTARLVIAVTLAVVAGLSSGAPAGAPEGGLFCHFCETTMGRVFNNETMNLLLDNTLRALCRQPHFMNYTDPVKCYNDLLPTGQKVIQDILKKYSPHKVCVALHLCTGDKAAVFPVILEPVIQAMIKDSSECEACRWGVSMLDGLLQSADVQNDIATIVKSTVCANLELPGLITACNDYMTNNFSVVLEFIAGTLSADILCSGLCPAPKPAVFPVIGSTKGPPSPDCYGCRIGVHMLQALLTDPGAQKLLKELITDYVCAKLPDSEKNVCNMVANFGPVIFNSIASILNDNLLCKSVC